MSNENDKAPNDYPTLTHVTLGNGPDSFTTLHELGHQHTRQECERRTTTTNEMLADMAKGLSIRHDISPMLMVDGVGKVEFRGVSVVDSFEKGDVKITAERVQEINYNQGQEHLLKVAAANFGISPELLENMSSLETSFATSIVNSSKQLSNVVAKVAPSIRAAIQKYGEHFSQNFYKRDIYLSIRKEVYGMKPKRVLPSGSMRKRRRHYYSDLIKKDIEVEGKLLKNAYPLSGGIVGKEPSSLHADETVKVSMSFAFDRADAIVKGR